MTATALHVFCDFDGTITQPDTLQFLTGRFGGGSLCMDSPNKGTPSKGTSSLVPLPSSFKWGFSPWQGISSRHRGTSKGRGNGGKTESRAARQRKERTNPRRR